MFSSTFLLKGSLNDPTICEISDWQPSRSQTYVSTYDATNLTEWHACRTARYGYAYVPGASLRAVTYDTWGSRHLERLPNFSLSARYFAHFQPGSSPLYFATTFESWRNFRAMRDARASTYSSSSTLSLRRGALLRLPTTCSSIREPPPSSCLLTVTFLFKRAFSTVIQMIL